MSDESVTGCCFDPRSASSVVVRCDGLRVWMKRKTVKKSVTTATQWCVDAETVKGLRVIVWEVVWIEI